MIPADATCWTLIRAAAARDRSREADDHFSTAGAMPSRVTRNGCGVIG
jgi:hypothetical protein